MDISSLESDPVANQTYAQWVRSAARRLTSGSGDAISLFDSSVAEPMEPLREIILDAFGTPVTDRYASVFTESNPFVVEALSARYSAPCENILCTTGATGALSLVYRTFLKRGDHIVVESPGFDIFTDIARSIGVSVSAFERAHPAYAVNPDEVMACANLKTRLIVLSNLHNPSGTFIEDGVLTQLAELASRRGVNLIVDEVYRDFAAPASARCTACNLHPSIISVSSLTKIYGLSTLRCGWVIAEPGLLANVRKVSDKFDFGTSKLAHAVAALVLERGEEFDRYTNDIVAAARPVVEGFAATLAAEGLVTGDVPQYGCIWFPRLVGVRDTRAFSDLLASEYGVFVAPGECFGAPGNVRIGFAYDPATLERGLARVHKGLGDFCRRGAKASAR